MERLFDADRAKRAVGFGRSRQIFAEDFAIFIHKIELLVITRLAKNKQPFEIRLAPGTDAIAQIYNAFKLGGVVAGFAGLAISSTRDLSGCCLVNSGSLLRKIRWPELVGFQGAIPFLHTPVFPAPVPNVPATRDTPRPTIFPSTSFTRDFTL